ncbi:hypothetical protein ABNE14_19725 [Paenibacillus larvae]
MKTKRPKSLVKKCGGIALASVIGFSTFGIFAASASAAENTKQVYANQSLKAEEMTITQLRNTFQHKDDPFINHVRIFIDKHLEESEFLWGKVSDSLKRDIVDLLTGDKKDYFYKVNRALIVHFIEVPSLLKSSSAEFNKEILQLLNYL